MEMTMLKLLSTTAALSMGLGVTFGSLFAMLALLAR